MRRNHAMELAAHAPHHFIGSHDEVELAAGGEADRDIFGIGGLVTAQVFM